MVHEPVDGCQRHGLVGENLAPFAEGLVGRDQQGSAFIAGGDQLEQHTGLGLILGDVSDIVEDQQLVLVELGDGGFEPQLPARHLQPLDEVGGTHENGSIESSHGHLKKADKEGWPAVRFVFKQNKCKSTSAKSACQNSFPKACAAEPHGAAGTSQLPVLQQLVVDL
jgi:hypothetical protein